MKKVQSLLGLLLACLVLVGMNYFGIGKDSATTPTPTQSVAQAEQLGSVDETEIKVVKGESYSDVDHVALYLHTFGELPPNYITKKEAEHQGWESHKGNLHKVLPGMSIGGDHFGNYDKLLPTAKGRSYKECDIDYVSGSRNAKRIIFSNDGLIYYTDDHYESFEQLY